MPEKYRSHPKTEFLPVAPTFPTPEQLQNQIDALEGRSDERAVRYKDMKPEAEKRYRKLQEQNARLAEVRRIVQGSGD